MNKKERINAAFGYLRENGIVRTQKELADKIGSTSPNVSSALKGVESVLTDSFLRRFYAAFSTSFNEEWIMEGVGDMLKSQPRTEQDEISRMLSLLESAQETIRKRDEQIDRLLTLLEKETERTETIVRRAV
ncbi:MAG: hypothetical protein IKO85_05235 [Bacteroidaceae bacterium]|nr:hypothetical protein [Bacteroidaceae bacterium]